MRLAERYRLPVLTFIDTPGAFPGMDSEERGINEAIAENMAIMSTVKTPLIATVTGEANSGGADRHWRRRSAQHAAIFHLHGYYSGGLCDDSLEVIRLCPAAAEAMGVTSKRLEELGIVDHTIPEPLGGAHRDVPAMAENIKTALSAQLDKLEAMPIDDLVARRYQRLMSYGISA